MASWALVIPVKGLDHAKSRLADAAGDYRADLALAMAADTVHAALRCPAVTAVVSVTDDARAAGTLGELGAVVVADEPDAGLNPALRYGASVARRYASSVGALSADLPALRPDALGDVLESALQFPSAFLPDLAETGTTLYAVTDAPFDPRFGHRSAFRHRRAGAVQLDVPGAESVRRDVDTRADLAAAVRLGVGAHTRKLAATVLGRIA